MSSKRIPFIVSAAAALACSAAFVSPLLVSNPASATDDKVYSTAICQQEGTSGTLKMDDRGRIWNMHSTQTLTVGCPIIRDDTGGGIDTAYVLVRDYHYTQNVNCSVGQWSNSGWGVNGRINRSSSGTGGTYNGGNQMLTFSGYPGYINNDYYYHLRCQIPPAYSGNYSALTWFKIKE